MNKIGIAVFAGIVVYIIIALWQYLLNNGLFIQTVCIILALLVPAGLIWAKETEKIKSIEMAAVWGCLYLFVLYGLLVVTGVL
ncbi:hypothetical protein L1994_05625 [Methanomicrobium antiquum]|uniref:Uncharacterized protein n=1 Tax=Methanomicrobium antiquum TaxID=487686 RepID=A0AAF0FP42_9EURY|nr:hypothetical protein [Methanomicrobium antiquum]MDD3977918.1 hypothetical protein [Methanomicrobium sp.]WFN37863.1 hypothetical protein L1994_05625 [Methanomicrobium antiquum]